MSDEEYSIKCQTLAALLAIHRELVTTAAYNLSFKHLNPFKVKADIEELSRELNLGYER